MLYFLKCKNLNIDDLLITTIHDSENLVELSYYD